MRWVNAIAVLVLLGVATTGCGGGADPGAHPLTGLYVMDVDRTLAASPPAEAGKQLGSTAEVVRQSLSAEQYSLRLEANWTFTLSVGAGEGAFTTTGRWGPTPAGLVLESTHADGEVVPPEDGGGQAIEAATREGWIVLRFDEQDIYLRRS